MTAASEWVYARGRVLLGAWLWVASTVLLASEIPAILAWDSARAGGYRPGQRAISDLGATTCTSVDYADGARAVCSPLHDLVNVSWVLSGLLLAVGAILLCSRLPGRAGTAAAALLGVGGLSLTATGLVPVDVDLELHLLVALPAFLVLNLALLLAARSLPSRERLLRRTAAALGVLGLLAAAATVAWGAVGGPLGAYERLATYAAPIWVLLAGFSWARRGHAPVS